MVKNELSIRSAQTRKIALKMAEHSNEKISTRIAKEISALRARIDFKELAQEYALFEQRKVYLKENVNALFNKSSLQAEEVFLNNVRLIEKLEWSFVKIDRSNPNHEAVRKQIATHRHHIVSIDNKYEKVKIRAKWDVYEQERDIEYKVNYSNYVSELYGSNPHLEEYPYATFIQKVNEEYENKKTSTLENLSSLQSKIDEVIEKAFEITFFKDTKSEIQTLTNEIIELKEQERDLVIQLTDHDIDLQVLKEQAKEKLDVFDERKELEALIASKTALKEETIKSIHEKTIQLENTYKQYYADGAKPFSVDVSSDDANENELLVNIAQSFKLKGNEVFNAIYEHIKNYVINLCPFYYDFLKEKEAGYNEQTIAYRKQVASTLNGDIAKAYANEVNYLKFIASNIDSSSLQQIDSEHEANLVKINDDFKANLVAIKEGKKNRKKEYLEQKAAAKTALKLADGGKASEIKEVLKIYKKDVNAGQLKRYYNAIVSKNRALKEEKERYQHAQNVATLPTALSYSFKFQNQANADKKAKKQELLADNKRLSKELSLSKYRKNLNTTTRENALGYLFLSVWAVGFVIFTLIPIGYTILMSFSNIVYDNQGYSKLFAFSFKTGLTFPNWTGWENFETLFLSDVTFAYTYVPQFFRSLLFYLPIVVFIGFVLAMLLNSKIKGRTFFRIIYFLPVVIVSGPVLSMLNESNTSNSSSIRLSLDGSSVAKILESLSPKALQYANEVFQNFIIILWMTGVPIVLFISALQKINKQLYEAAEIDGANKWQMLWTITFPLIKSVLLIVCLFTIMQITTINVSFVNPINSWLENMLSNGNNYGIVALGSWVQTLIVLFFVSICYLLFREKEFVSKDKNYEEIEEAKRKKAQRKAKIAKFFHVRDINNFFTKVFAPITKAIDGAKERRKQKKEMEG